MTRILASLFFVTLCLTAAAPARADSSVDCSAAGNWQSEACATAKQPSHGAPVPYSGPMICARIIQWGNHKVAFLFFDAQGHELDADDKNHIFDASEDSVHCTGRDWWEKVNAVGGWVYICNDWVQGAPPEWWHGHTIIRAGTPAMNYLLEHGKMPPTGFSCLKGSEECKRLAGIYGKI